MHVHEISLLGFFHESDSYLMIFSAIMSDIKIMKGSVFIPFWYGEFNGAIGFK